MQRKRAEILTLKLAAMAPRYHCLPACDELAAQCREMNAGLRTDDADRAAVGRTRLVRGRGLEWVTARSRVCQCARL